MAKKTTKSGAVRSEKSPDTVAVQDTPVEVAREAKPIIPKEIKAAVIAQIANF